MDLGELAGRVEDICHRQVDIVWRRRLPERDSELVFRIADEGVPILESRRYAFADFKKEARRNLAPPASYRECIEALSAAGLLGEELADSIKRMIGLRNLLIHEHDDVDTARLLPLLDRLDDLRAFADWYVSLEQE